jgi:hypothetical protein
MDASTGVLQAHTVLHQLACPFLLTRQTSVAACHVLLRFVLVAELCRFESSQQLPPSSTWSKSTDLLSSLGPKFM